MNRVIVGVSVMRKTIFLLLIRAFIILFGTLPILTQAGDINVPVPTSDPPCQSTPGCPCDTTSPPDASTAPPQSELMPDPIRVDKKIRSRAWSNTISISEGNLSDDIALLYRLWNFKISAN